MMSQNSNLWSGSALFKLCARCILYGSHSCFLKSLISKRFRYSCSLYQNFHHKRGQNDQYNNFEVLQIVQAWLKYVGNKELSPFQFYMDVICSFTFNDTAFNSPMSIIPSVLSEESGRVWQVILFLSSTSSSSSLFVSEMNLKLLTSIILVSTWNWEFLSFFSFTGYSISQQYLLQLFLIRFWAEPGIVNIDNTGLYLKLRVPWFYEHYRNKLWKMTETSQWSLQYVNLEFSLDTSLNWNC